jgi:hypothetical protein
MHASELDPSTDTEAVYGMAQLTGLSLALGRDFEAMPVSRICDGAAGEVRNARCLTKKFVGFYMTQSVRCPNDPAGEMPDGGAADSMSRCNT